VSTGSIAPVLAELSKVIKSASPRIREGVKWNSPSFYVDDEQWFATADSRAKGKAAPAVTLVLHRGARTKGKPPADPDPKGIFGWVAPDRGIAKFATKAEVAAVAPALRALIRRWIKEL
jgi:hypothetical protein